MYGYTLLPEQQPQQQPQQRQLQPVNIQVPIEVHIAQIAAQTRQIDAIARINESFIILNGMAEIRMALNIPSVAENDSGTSERAPLKPMFEPEQVTRLQEAYMRLSERYYKFAHHVMKNELKVEQGNEEKR